MKNTLKSSIEMLKLLRNDHPAIYYVFALGAISGAVLPYYTLYFSSQLLNGLYAGRVGDAKVTVIYLLIGSFLLGLISHICNQAMDVYYSTVDNSYNRQFTDKAYHLAYEKYERKETLEKMRMIKDNARGGNYPSAQLKRIYDILTGCLSTLMALVYIIILFFFSDGQSSILISVIFIALLGLFLFLSFCYNEKGNQKKIFFQKKNIEANAYSSYIFNLCFDTVKGKEIRLFHMISVIKKYIDKTNALFNNNSKKWSAVEANIDGMNSFLLQIFSGISFFYVGYQALSHSIEVGDILLYTGAITQLATGLVSILGNYSKAKFCFEASINLYHDFINSSDMDYDGTLPIEKRDDNCYYFQFEDVSFKYPGTDQMILNHINLDFNVGESYAIVGQNGAGKSTLIKLLFRLYEPTEGRILLNGIDIKKYNYEEYTEVFSVVFQDFKLYALNLDENIACSESVDENKVQEVLKQVGIYDHIMEHPNGTQQLLYKETGNGVTVSGGEAQKIAIARALYKDAPFVILDEPTSALDPISEAEIYENFNNMIKDKTAIYISHRMSSCRFCDHIVVLDQGEVEEYGDHETLIKQNGLYSELWNAQAQYYN